MCTTQPRNFKADFYVPLLELRLRIAITGYYRPKEPVRLKEKNKKKLICGNTCSENCTKMAKMTNDITFCLSKVSS